MATRSTIALEYADGTVDQIYSHWDGYLEYNGTILFQHYQDPFKVRELMDLGDVSSLGASLGEKHDFDAKHEADTLADTRCTFYARDRGETGCEAKRFKSFADYVANHQYEEYEYILRTDGNWYVSAYNRSSDTGAYTLLSEAIANEIKETV